MAMANVSGIALSEAGGDDRNKNFDEIVNTLQTAAKGAVPEVINSAKAQFANASQMLGIGEILLPIITYNLLVRYLTHTLNNCLITLFDSAC